MQALAMKSFIEYDGESHFPLENIPFGCYKSASGKNHCCTRIGDKIIDLADIFSYFDGPLFKTLTENIFDKENLNDFAALGVGFRVEARETIQKLFSETNAANKDALAGAVKDVAGCEMVMPVFIRDYTDFYSSKNHAYNIGVMMRGKDNALQPNWTHLPVGYHGRASSIVIDGTPITRPKGQLSPPEGEKQPSFNACRLLDFELEMGTVIGMGNKLGQPVKLKDAGNHIFGHCMFNDWSARDIQKWEYVPLGPFLAKNFASTISPWIITPEALAPFKVALPAQDPAMLPYLKDDDLSSYDVQLQVALKSSTMDEWHVITNSNMKHLYYSVAQTVTHHTVTGCNLNPGDMFGTGTISATEKSGYGSMMELSWRGSEPIKLPNGEERKFLQDGDEVNLIGFCKGNGYTIGFGDCRGKVLPAIDDSNYF